MSFFDQLFHRHGSENSRRAPQNMVIEAPPEDAEWHTAKARSQHKVHAKLARHTGEVRTEHGPLRFRAGEHYIVRPKTGGVSVVRRDTFHRIYQRRWLGGYEKRPNIVYRYFTLPHAATIKTQEGPQRALAGDWIMQGLDGELWPVSVDEAERRYDRLPDEVKKPEPTVENSTEAKIEQTAH